VTDKFAFIDAEKAMFPIVKMCVWLEVSTSGYYEWRDRPAPATVQRRQRLAALVQAIFEQSDSTYGYRRGARRAGPPGRRLRSRAGPGHHA
jgi:putative transposase